MKAASTIAVLGSSLASVLVLFACGDGGTKAQTLARLEAFDDGVALPENGVIGVSANALAVGVEEDVSAIRFVNTASDDLVITAVEIESTPPGVFRLAGDPDGGALPTFPVRVAPQDGVDGTRSLYVYLMMTRPEPGGATPQATIRVSSNSVSTDGDSQEVIAYQVRLQSTAPTIQVTPRVVNFETVQQGQSDLQSINILNPGAETLLIDSFTLSGHPNFELVIGSRQYPVSAESASTGIVLDTPIAVERGVTVPVTVRYTAEDGGEARGQVVFFSNDPAAAAGTVVTLQANVGGPCISVSPSKVSFGGKKIGNLATIDVEITSCGDQNLVLTEIGLTPDSSGLFALSLAALQGAPGGASSLGPSDTPVVLQPNQKTTVSVQYFPESVSPVDGNNQPILDRATLRIRSNSFQPELLTEVTGFGVLKECPTAVIVVTEGEEVIPQTELHLVGSQSTSSTGEIERYEWTVIPPEGSASVFFPSANAADPRFEVNVAGPYKFRLEVVDSAGERSCVPAEVEVFVNPDEAIHTELLWDTPGDPDQTDENGADLDLHFLHPFAVGGHDGDGDGIMDGWFDIPFDAFWSNEFPNWASSDPNVDDNPGLDRDDVDGAGPENLNLNLPEDGLTYRVGVHYWDDHDFGVSYATVKVYIYANLVFDIGGVELFQHDMWTVTNITWPPGGTAPALVKACGGATTACVTDSDCGAAKCGYRIAPNYVHPQFISGD